MSVEALVQLRAMREKIADSLRQDPRYLTVSALDKSIVEIANVMKAFEAPGTTSPPADPSPLDHI